MQNLNSHEKLISEIQNGNISQLKEANFKCTICNCFISGQSQAESHVVGIQHDKKLKLGSQLMDDPSTDGCHSEAMGGAAGKICSDINGFYCTICDVCLTGRVPFYQHENGRRHKQKVELLQKPSYLDDTQSKLQDRPIPLPRLSKSSPISSCKSSPSPTFIADKEKEIGVLQPHTEMKFCNICNVAVTGKFQMEQHLKGKSHAKRLAIVESRRTSMSRTSDTGVSPFYSADAILSQVENLQRNDASPQMNNAKYLPTNLSQMEKSTIRVEVNEPIPKLF